MRLRATVRVRNDAMVAARQAARWSQADLAREAGTSVNVVQRLEALDYSQPGTVAATADVAMALGLAQADVLPPDLVGERVPTTMVCISEVPTDRLLAARSERLALPAPDEALIAEETRAALRAAVDALAREPERGIERRGTRARMARILRRRYGLDGRPPATMDEIARCENISGTNVANLEARAMHALRCTSGSRDLRRLVEDGAAP